MNTYAFKLALLFDDNGATVYPTGLIHAESLAAATEKLADEYDERCILGCQLTYITDYEFREIPEDVVKAIYKTHNGEEMVF